MQPMNYTIDTGNAGNAFAQGFQNTAGMMATAADYQRAQQLATQQQQAAELDAQKRADFAEAAANPTYEKVRALMIKHPELSEQFERSLKPLDARRKENLMAGAFSAKEALEAGNTDAFTKLIDQNIEAAEKSGDQDMLDRFKSVKYLAAASPSNAILTLHGTLFGGLGADGYEKLQKAKTESATRGAAVRKGEAEADSAEVTAQYADATAQAGLAKTGAEVADKKSAISERAARLGLDRDKFNLDFDSKLAELQGKTQVTLSAGMEKMQAESVTKSLTATDLANKSEMLAGAMEKAGQFGGAWSWVSSKSADLLGVDFDVNALRREYVALRNKGVIDGLPPGVATDKDIELVKAGFPGENADSATISKWLRSFSNVQKAAAKREEAQAEWIANVGSLSNARRDIDIGGVKVPAGTSFTDFVKRSGSASPGASGAPAKADLNYFLQKYK